MRFSLFILLVLSLAWPAAADIYTWVLANAGTPTSPPGPPDPPDPNVEAYYLDPVYGSNGNDGRTLETPWATFAWADTHIAAGATLYLMDGDYDTLTIDTAQQRSSWAEAVTITPAYGADPNIEMVDINGDYDRYLIFDGLTVRHPDTQHQTTTDVVFSIDSHYVNLQSCAVFGFLGVGTRYETDDSYTQEATTDAAVQIYGSNVDINDCTIMCSLFGVDIPTTIEDCNVSVRNSRLGYTPGQCIQTGGTPRGAEDILIEGNTIGPKVWATPHYVGYVHGTAILLWTDGATIRNNIVFGFGDDGTIRGAIHAGDGSFQFTGSYADSSHTLSIGDYVTQGSVVGRYLGTRGSTPYYCFGAETEAMEFIAGVPIIADDDAETIFTPSALVDRTRWGGMQELKIHNNLIYHINIGTGGIHIYEAGPGLEIINNTIIGVSNGRTGPTYFESASRIGLPPYYADLTDMKICNNLLVGLVNLCENFDPSMPGIFPPGCTAVGNVIWCANGNTGGGAATYTSQDEMDAAWPGNTVLCWAVNNNDVGLIEDDTFVGGYWYDDYAFSPTTRRDGIIVPGYGVVNDVYCVAPAVTTLGHVYDLAATAAGVDYADSDTATSTDVWGVARDALPDTGAEEYGN